MTVAPMFAPCRVYGHDWDSVSVSFEPKFYIETLRCDVCGAERADRVSKWTGFIVSRSYRYPKGYQQKGGVTREEVGDMRLNILSSKYYGYPGQPNK